MNTFEAECHQLQSQLKDMQKAYEMLQNEKIALEVNFKEIRPVSPVREEPSRQGRSPPHIADQLSRPVRPTPNSWVRSSIICYSERKAFLFPLRWKFVDVQSRLHTFNIVLQEAGQTAKNRSVCMTCVHRQLLSVWQARFATGGESFSFYHDFVRNIISKYLGEDYAKQADAEPFKYAKPNDLAVLYGVSSLLYSPFIFLCCLGRCTMCWLGGVCGGGAGGNNANCCPKDLMFGSKEYVPFLWAASLTICSLWYALIEYFFSPPEVFVRASLHMKD